MSTPILQTKESIKVIADIIATEMDLDITKQVVIYNQKYNIPTSEGLFVALSLLAPKVIGAKSEVNLLGEEVQSAAIIEMIQIDIMSANADARLRHFEVLLALNSIYSQQQQELYNIKIARLPSTMSDASSLEGSAIMNRYVSTVLVNSVITKTKSLSGYFDSLQGPEIKIDQFPNKDIDLIAVTPE
jgi:hypothetical protein